MRDDVTLPKGWVWTTLEQPCDVIMGQSPPSDTYNAESDGLPFYQGKTEFGDLYPTPVKWCSRPNKIAQTNDVLISVRAPVGPTNLCREKSCIGRGLAAVHPLEGMPSKYFLYALRSFVDNLTEKATGTTFSAISGTVLRSQPIPLAPLPEQQRIVNKIEEIFTQLDAGVAALKRVQANLKRYKASVLKAACEGQLVAQDSNDEPAGKLLARILVERKKKWEDDLRAKGKDLAKAKYVEPQSPNVDELPELPRGWMWARAEQLCDFITKGTTPSASKLFSGGGETPFIKVYNLTYDTTLDFSLNPTFISKRTHQEELARSKVFPNDVLMNIVGPPLGKVSIVPETYPEWNINQAIAIFRPLLSYDRKFLAFCLLAESILSWATKRAKATAGQFNLTLEICRDLPLPLPPLAEQHSIVAEIERRLSVAQELEKVVEANLTRAERLRQSILKRAFEGKLVAQDPNDESAEKLLERVREGRAKLKH